MSAMKGTVAAVIAAAEEASIHQEAMMAVLLVRVVAVVVRKAEVTLKVVAATGATNTAAAKLKDMMNAMRAVVDVARVVAVAVTNTLEAVVVQVLMEANMMRIRITMITTKARAGAAMMKITAITTKTMKTITTKIRMMKMMTITTTRNQAVEEANQAEVTTVKNIPLHYYSTPATGYCFILQSNNKSITQPWAK